MNKIFSIVVFLLVCSSRTWSQGAHQIIEQVRAKLDMVNSYEADGLMKTKVNFLKVPDAEVKVYYKRPDKLKIKNERGISLIPRGTMVFSMNSLLRGAYTAIDGGYDSIPGTRVRIIKLVPEDDNAPWVISTVFVDEKRLLILKAKTTTREKGTFEVDMVYGKYIKYALPDKVTCSFNTKDFKLPKGITFDYDDGSHNDEEKTKGDTKGSVEITYSAYAVNRNLPDNIFQDAK